MSISIISIYFYNAWEQGCRSFDTSHARQYADISLVLSSVADARLQAQLEAQSTHAAHVRTGPGVWQVELAGSEVWVPAQWRVQALYARRRV